MGSATVPPQLRSQPCSRAAVRTPLYSSQITPEPIRDGPKLMYINLPVRVLVHPGDDPIDHLLRQIRP